MPVTLSMICHVFITDCPNFRHKRLSVVSYRTFPVAAAGILIIRLPRNVTRASSLQIFFVKSRLRRISSVLPLNYDKVPEDKLLSRWSL